MRWRDTLQVMSRIAGCSVALPVLHAASSRNGTSSTSSSDGGSTRATLCGRTLTIVASCLPALLDSK
jgi:hypothetical protein